MKYRVLKMLVVCGSIFCLTGCGVEKPKETEIVWYLSNPSFYGVNPNKIEPFSEVESERFTLFNERLKELEIPASVTFKYVPKEFYATDEDYQNDTYYQSEFLHSMSFVKQLIQHDKEADLSEFAPMEYDQFIPLDQELAKEDNNKVYETIPEQIWNANKIKGSMYQVPKGNVSVRNVEYCFSKKFVEKYQIPLDAEKLAQMSPHEVVEMLQPYFEKERFLDNQYYLCDGDMNSLMTYYQSEYMPLVSGYSAWNLAVDLEHKQIIHMLDTPEEHEMLQLADWIYVNDYDAHIEQEAKQTRGVPVFTINAIASIPELNAKEEDYLIHIPLQKSYITDSIGNGVLKNSDTPELAAQVLAATMYDEELSNIMIYGVPDQDYELDGNRAYYKKEQLLSSLGSFSQIGNNAIAYVNEAEVEEKYSLIYTVLEQTPQCSMEQFVPELSDELLQKLANINKVYYDIHGTVGREQIMLDSYIEEKKQALEKEDIDEVLKELQMQLEKR